MVCGRPQSDLLASGQTSPSGGGPPDQDWLKSRFFSWTGPIHPSPILPTGSLDRLAESRRLLRLAPKAP